MLLNPYLVPSRVRKGLTSRSLGFGSRPTGTPVAVTADHLHPPTRIEKTFEHAPGSLGGFNSLPAALLRLRCHDHSRNVGTSALRPDNMLRTIRAKVLITLVLPPI